MKKNVTLSYLVLAFLGVISCGGNNGTSENSDSTANEENKVENTNQSDKTSNLLGKWSCIDDDEIFEFKEDEYAHYWHGSLTGNEKYKISDTPISEADYDDFSSLKNGKIINPKGKFPISYSINDDILTIRRGPDGGETDTKFKRQIVDKLNSCAEIKKEQTNIGNGPTEIDGNWMSLTDKSIIQYKDERWVVLDASGQEIGPEGRYKISNIEMNDECMDDVTIKSLKKGKYLNTYYEAMGTSSSKYSIEGNILTTDGNKSKRIK